MLKMVIESLKNLVSEPETIKYPFEPSPEPPGYRGVIEYNEELCIFCDKCENICPPGAIKFVVVDYETGKKEYNYNPYLCIYCGACVRECPKAEEGCLVQREYRTPPLGEKVPKGERLGYFINRIDNPKEVEKKWREIEELSRKSREEYKAYRKAKRAKKAKPKPATEADTPSTSEKSTASIKRETPATPNPSTSETEKGEV
jgi:NADH-quinone oxidoreductase subunit I